MKRILLQTTLLEGAQDNWTIDTFSMLREYLATLTDEQGNSLYEVTARDRQPDAEGNDPVLSTLDQQGFDQLWLFALDVGDGLSQADCAGITRFHQQGKGILATRDHQDMGISMCPLKAIGGFHYFHSRQPDPDPDRLCRDDTCTLTINYPNYHSGKNGDFQVIRPLEPMHELLKDPSLPNGVITRFPAHPHEGGVGVSPGADYAQVIAVGTSKVTGREFSLAVAAEQVADADGHLLGRVVAQSTFHHFVDYNWDISKGCPSFVEEPPGDGMATDPQAINEIHAYVRNLAAWL